jgi:F-type H+-transporting ATPase subunit alpha
MIFELEKRLKDIQSLNFLNEEEKTLLKKIYYKSKEIIVETSDKLGVDEKERIKDDLNKKYSQAFLIFKTNKDLIGGIRVYVDGTLIDESWNNQINKISDLTPEPIQDIKNLKEIIKKITLEFTKEDTNFLDQNFGVIKSYQDGIIKISGLKNPLMNEILKIHGTNLSALAMYLTENETSALVLNDFNSSLKEGMYVSQTGKLFEIPASKQLLGRVINFLGNPIDDLGEILPEKFIPIEKIAPGVITRQPVKDPLETGILIIDSLIPIGKGQRELIIGDRQTGKSTIAIDTILNQRNKDVICIYVCIGQRESFVSNLYEKIKGAEADKYTIILNAPSSAPAVQQYLAPYSGTAIAEFFLEQGKDVLIVYDDLSKHAVAYREISLLLKRPPGREAYPGDVFYLHSRLLERSVKLNQENGGGSITALPIAETQAADVSAYIPTNLISITDGQIFLEPDLFNKGILPAVNVGISVSRVGGSAQTKIMKKVSGRLKLDLASYFELEAFSQFSSDLDENTKKTLERGKRTVESLIQKQNSPYNLSDEILILFLVSNGFLDKVEVEKVAHRIKEFLLYVNQNDENLITEINQKKELTEELSIKIKDICTNFFNK